MNTRRSANRDDYWASDDPAGHGPGFSYFALACGIASAIAGTFFFVYLMWFDKPQHVAPAALRAIYLHEVIAALLIAAGLLLGGPLALLCGAVALAVYRGKSAAAQ